MGKVQELSSLKIRLAAIQAEHATNGAITKDEFIGASSPDGAINYLSQGEFNDLYAAGYIRKRLPSLSEPVNIGNENPSAE